MSSLFLPQQSMWDASLDQTPLRNVAFSVAEAALESDPNSPSFNFAMTDLMNTPPLSGEESNLWVEDMGTWPRAKTRAASFAGRGQPLWQIVESAKERREREKDDDSFEQVVTLPTTVSADPSPIDSTFLDMKAAFRTQFPRLSAREFAAKAEKDAGVVAHVRTQSDAERSASPRVVPTRRRLPSLAQIQAKMSSVAEGQRYQPRSDSWDSVDSDGPQTPTDEVVSFNLPFRRPETPDSPQSSRLAPFLRERTNGRLARPKSMPPLNDSPQFNERPATSYIPSRQFSLPPTPPSFQRTSRQMSLPATPGSPSRQWNRDMTILVTPPGIPEHSPMSPTESVTSASSQASSSLPIITCTPAEEEDSDNDSEGDVIVFAGDLDDDEEDRREREALGRDMRDRLLRRSS